MNASGAGRFVFTRCNVCHDKCWHDRNGNYLALPARIVRLSTNEVRVVELRRRPKKGTAFAVNPDGSIPRIVTNPCTKWKRRILRRYRAGTRFIRFEPLPSSGSSGDAR